jgi:hypothetical protein
MQSQPITNILCANDQFAEEWLVYFRRNGILTPIAGEVYTVRKIVRFPFGPWGVLLNELTNAATPRISPTTGVHGTSEQAWSVDRFTDLNGEPLLNYLNR